MFNSSSDKSPRFQSLIALLILGWMAGIFAAHGEEFRTTTRPQVSIPWIQIGNVKHDPTGIEFEATILSGTKFKEPGDPWVFCVPSEGDLRIKVVDYSLDGQSLVPRAEDAPTTAWTAVSTSAEIHRLGFMRRWPLATVRVNSGFLDPVREIIPTGGGSKSRATVTARLRIEWDTPRDMELPPPHSEDLSDTSSWRKVAQTLVANTQGLRRFQVAIPPIREEINLQIRDPRAALPPPAQGSRKWLRLRVEGEGPHRISLKHLAETGWAEEAADPGRLRLFHGMASEPLLRRGVGNESEIYFWNGDTATYSKDRVYWLTADSTLPDPLFKTDASSGSLPAEPFVLAENVTRLAVLLDHDRDLRISYGDFQSVRAMRWVDAPLEPGIAHRIHAELPNADFSSPTPPKVDAVFRFYFELDSLVHSPVSTHGIQVAVTADGGATTTMTFTDDLHATFGLQLPVAAVTDGATTFTLKLLVPIQNHGILQLWFDSLEIRYPGKSLLRDGRLTLRHDDAFSSRGLIWTQLDEPSSPLVFSIHANSPPSLTPASMRGDARGILRANDPRTRIELYDPATIPWADRFEVPQTDDLASEEQGADYLIVAHDDFLTSVERLAAFHRDAGRCVRVVSVQSVYDQFSGGEMSPFALRDFFAHTLAHWKHGAPQQILLVGDCTSDYLDYAKKGVRNWVPSFSYPAMWNQWASDEWMGLVAGKDSLSDFMIGRISVNNGKDLDVVITNIINHASSNTMGPWRNRSVLVADNEPEYPKLLNDFSEHNVPGAFETVRDYLSELPMQDNYYAEDERRRFVFAQEGRWMKISSHATEKLRAAFLDGAAMISYFGHGSPNVWADERIWFGGASPNSDNLSLKGSRRAPFVVNFTCNSGAIDYPIPQWNVNIIEDMLRVENGGAIGAFVPSGPGQTTMQDPLGHFLFDTVFEDRLETLGEIATLTRLRMAALGTADEYVYMYILLGDPLSKMDRVTDARTFDLPKPAYQRNEAIEVTLEKVEPASGKFVAQLAAPNGETLWWGVANPYSNGEIKLNVVTVPSLPDGQCILRVYAWDEISKRDMAASGKYEVAPMAATPPGFQLASGPLMRFRLESTRTEPEIPSEGNTIFVHATLENAGDQPTSPAQASLYPTDPRLGAEPVYNHNTYRTQGVEIAPIPPGGSRDIALRWDPSFNAGDQTYWIKIDTTPNIPGDQENDLLADGKVHVKSTWKLGFRNVRAEANEEDARAMRIRLSVDVVNQGETDAKSVSVAFFRGGKAILQNVINEQTLPVIPANSSVPVNFEWNFGTRENLADADGVRGFRVQVWIKGTKLRITTPLPEPPPAN